MGSYGQFCPVAKAMELLDERWTMLVIRELVAGSTHFNELRRGVPKMSPALLSKRLRTLTRAGVVQRLDRDNRVVYQLTDCGRELTGVVEALGAWGTRWIGELGEDDLDPHLLLWDMRRNIRPDTLPRGRTVIHLDFVDVPAATAQWWLVITGDEVDICDYDPGFEVAVSMAGSLRTLTRIWRGDTAWEQAFGDGSVTLTGPVWARREVPNWLHQSPFAAVPRPLATAR